MSTAVKGIKNGNSAVQTFVLEQTEQEMCSRTSINYKIWQILPATTASLTCFSYGIMLGWPSPTYPKLLLSGEASPIPISIDQSAMIAGFLMIGNTLGTTFSYWSYFGSKLGLILVTLCMVIGWIIMWHAVNIYYLLVSRFLIGLACGFGMGQLKTYITEMCHESTMRDTLVKLINFYTFLGIVAAFILGCVTSFRQFSLIATIITCSILVLCVFLPHTPKEYLRYGKIRQAKLALGYLKPNCELENEIQQTKLMLYLPETDLNIVQVCKNKSTLKHTIVLSVLVFFQQFTGAPATIVYTQVIFSTSSCPYPQYCAIAYILLFTFASFLGTFCMNSYNKKKRLLASNLGVSFALILNIITFYFKFDEIYWKYISVVTMFLYIFLYSIGLGVIPLTLPQDYLPEDARRTVGKLQICLHSMFALAITKIFQVLYDQFEIYVSFCLFLCVSLSCSIYVSVFM